MNPADNNELVHRGAVATPMAYALKNLGESITGNTYPEPFAKWNNGVQLARWTSNVIFVASLPVKVIHVKGYLISIPTTLIKGRMTQSAIAAILDFLASVDSKIIEKIAKDESLTKIAEVLDAFPTECGLVAPSADLISLCIIGKPLIVQHKDFWRDLWNEYGNDNFIKVAQKGTLPINLIHNLAIASGTWSHETFNDWANFNDKPYSEILYAIMNGNAPIKSKTFYENALFTAQCEGTWHAGKDTFGNGGAYANSLPWHSDNVFADRGELKQYAWPTSNHGLDYMLMYNMYRMAEMLYWQNGVGTRKDIETQCPCKTYPSVKHTNYTPSILEKPQTFQSIYINGRPYRDMQCMVADTLLLADSFHVQPIYDYYQDFNMRIPNYLLHNATVKGQTGFVGFPVAQFAILEGLINVKQDLTICQSVLKLDEYGRLRTEPSNNEGLPSKVIVTSGSVLEILNDGVLEINNNTQVIIEKGAKLILHAGNTIILNGPNAVLHINGRLVMEQNAVFKPIKGTLDCGKVIIENNAGEQFVETKGNNEYIIDAINKPANYNLIVRGEYGMHTGWGGLGLRQFEVKNASVFIEGNSQLTSEASKTNFDNVLIQGEEYTRPRGIKLISTLGKIKNTEITFVKNGLEYIPLNFTYPLYINNVIIRECDKGVWSQGGGVIADSCSVYDNWRVGSKGINLYGVSNPSWIKNSDIKIPYHPIADTSSHWFWNTPSAAQINVDYFGSSVLKISKTRITEGLSGLNNKDGTAIIECSEFDYWTISPQSEIAIVSLGGALGLSNGYNSIDKYNEYLFTSGAMLYLDKGNNMITRRNNPYLYIEMHPKQKVQPTAGRVITGGGVNPNCLPASYNMWRPDQVPNATDFKPYSSTNYNFMITDHIFSDYYDIGYINHLQLTQPFSDFKAQECAKTNRTLTITPVAHYDPNDNTLKLHEEMSPIDVDMTPVNPYDINPKDYKDVFLTIATGVLDSPWVDYSTNLNEANYLRTILLPDSLFYMAMATYDLSHAIYYLSIGDTSLVDTALASRKLQFGNDMLSKQNELIAMSENNDSFWRYINYELKRDKALILRSLDRRPEGIIVLDDLISETTNNLQVKLATSWKCFLTQEQMVLDSIISVDDMDFESCVDIPDLMSTTNNSNSSMQQTSTNNLIIKNMVLYPNPSTNGFYLEALQNLQLDRVNIYDAMGKKVSAPITLTNEKQLYTDTKNLAVGIYIVSYQLSAKEKAEFRVTVIK